MRGRPPRAGARATRRVELRLTEAELRAVRRLAKANGCSLAHVMRLAVNWLSAFLDEGGAPPLVLGGRIIITEAPPDDLLDLLPVLRRSRCASSEREGTPS